MKKLLSVLLALTMVLSFMPTLAFADDGESEETFYLDNGSITIEAKSDGKQYVTQVNGVADEEQTGKIVITQSSTAATTNTITIKAAESRTAYVTLSGVNIDVSSQYGSVAVSTAGKGNVVVELNGTNTVKSGRNRAGLEKNNTSSLTITDADNNGSLSAMGGYCGAGIGGGYCGDGSNITISGGNVTATGGDFGAGIGGGDYGSGSNITISGGAVTAKGGTVGAGIGGGSQAYGSGITVSGDAQVKVQGGKEYKKNDFNYGSGAPIGNGAQSGSDGAEVSPDISKLTTEGEIKYYAPGADMATAAPTMTFTGTACSHTLVKYDAKAATCTEKGNVEYWHCSVCGKNFTSEACDTEIADVETEKNASNHSGTAVWTQTATTHKQVYSCCQVVNVAETNHTWQDGKCTVCNYVCQHTDTDKNHICDICGKTLSDHTGGKATCTKEAVCDYCGKAYGNTDPSNHSGTAVWMRTATTHEKKWDCCNAVVVASEPHEWENGKCSECGYVCLHSGGKATCKDKAVCVVCGEEYGDLAPHELTHIAAKAATAAEFGNTEYWHCDVCNKYFSDEKAENEIALADTVISKLAPKIIAGDGATVTQGEKKALSFTSDAAFDDFLRVEVDGKTVNESSYTVKSGSTVVTLNADYVATLSVGEHTLGIVSESGTATAKFTVNKKAAETTGKTDKPTTDDNKKSPQTGDSSNLALWIALLFISGGAVIGTTVVGRKKKYNN